MLLNKATLSEQIYSILKNDILNQTIPQGGEADTEKPAVALFHQLHS